MVLWGVLWLYMVFKSMNLLWLYMVLQGYYIVYIYVLSYLSFIVLQYVGLLYGGGFIMGFNSVYYLTVLLSVYLLYVLGYIIDQFIMGLLQV